MLRGMSAMEFRAWLIYQATEPIGERRADLRIATIVKALWDIARDRKKHPKAFALEDFVLRFEEDARPPGPRRTQTLEQQTAILHAIAAAYAPARADVAAGKGSDPR